MALPRDIVRVPIMALILSAACGSHAPQTAAPAPRASARPPAPTLRLPAGPRPTAYRLDLHLDPTASEFQGVVDIDLELPERTGFVWMNGAELTVRSAEAVVGDRRIGATAVPAEEFLGFELAEPLSGKATLHVVYT